MTRVPVSVWRAQLLQVRLPLVWLLWGLTSWTREHHVASRPQTGGADTPGPGPARLTGTGSFRVSPCFPENLGGRCCHRTQPGVEEGMEAELK